MGSAPSVTHRVVAAGEEGMRAAGADRRDRVQPRRVSTLASLRTNDRQGTHGPKFVAAWTQWPLLGPVGHVPHCHVVVARAVATGEREDRSGGQSIPRRRTHPPGRREAENRSSLPRRASRRDNPHPNRSGCVGILERVLHSAEHPKILDSCSYPGPIKANDCNHFSNSRMPVFSGNTRSLREMP
jgi:hypothetical protein